MVGSSLRVKGGMTTVVESFLHHKFDKNIELKYVSTHIDTKNQIFKKIYFLISLINICIQLCFGRVKIVHMHMSERGSFRRKFIIFRLAKFFDKQVITHTHGAEFESYFKYSNNKTQIKIKKLLKDSDVVITLGETWNKIIKNIEQEANTFILRNSVPIPPKENTINNEKIKILFLAVLIERKGIIDLIEASNKIIKEVEKNRKQVEFIIAGEGELLVSSKVLVKKLKLDKYFNFVGWVNNEQKHQLLQDTDLFILPSYNEGLPLSILEAISYGIPIISTNVGSINEAVKNGENGYLITPGDKEILADYTIKLINEINFYDMGKTSRLIAKEFFDIDNYFKKVENLYFRLEEAKRGDR